MLSSRKWGQPYILTPNPGRPESKAEKGFAKEGFGKEGKGREGVTKSHCKTSRKLTERNTKGRPKSQPPGDAHACPQVVSLLHVVTQEPRLFPL